ncbi:MAG: hypothetical protein Kow0068_06410 [Marinilabiliales bacterium]
MKRILISITLASLAILLAFTSCKKDEDKDIDLTLTTATITGKVWAQLVDTNVFTANEYEYAPTSVKIIAVYNTQDLVDDPAANYTYQDKTVETNVGSDGTYTLSIPARGKNVNVTLKAQDFIYDRLIWDTYPTSTKTERTIYQTADKFTTVVAGDVKVIDFYY